jgi:hypothetical protein
VPVSSAVRCPNALKKATGAITALAGVAGVKGTAKCLVCGKAIRVDLSGRFLDHRLK